MATLTWMTARALAVVLLVLAGCGGPLEYEVECTTSDIVVDTGILASDVHGVDVLVCPEEDRCFTAVLTLTEISDSKVRIASVGCDPGDTVRITVWR